MIVYCAVCRKAHVYTEADAERLIQVQIVTAHGRVLTATGCVRTCEFGDRDCEVTP